MPGLVVRIHVLACWRKERRGWPGHRRAEATPSFGRLCPAMTKSMKIYLAGPDVFLPDAVDIGRRKVELCAHHGLIGLYPLDNAIDRAASDVSLRIFRGNEEMMIEADAIIANLTPFRGPRADPGTVYEVGYMGGIGKLCLGYSNDPSTYADRVRQFTAVNSRDGRLVDAQGLTVEDFGLTDNLMMIHALDL